MGKLFGLTMRSFCCGVLVLLAVALGGEAQAQPATALDRLDPSPAGDELLSLPTPEVRGELQPAAGFALSYAHAPLVLVSSDEEDDPVAEVVGHQLILHNLVSLELWRRLKLEVDVPLTLTQGGDSDARFDAAPSGFAMNDIRIGARVELLRQSGFWPAAAVAITGWMPSGDDAAYSGTGAPRIAPALLLGLSRDELIWSVMIGRRFEALGAEDAPSLRGSEIVFGTGAGPRFGPLQVAAELFGSTVSEPGITAFARETTSLEVLASGQYRLGPVLLRLAGGPGFLAGAGTPRFRVIASALYAPAPPARPAAEPEPDDTGQAKDVAPDKPQPPVLTASSTDTRDTLDDRDGDTVKNDADLCPDVVGDPSPAAARRGCPPDRDGDGVADADDACVDVPGVRSADPQRDGCPADRDGDGIVDPEDACPNEKGIKTEDPKTHGCPKLVRVTGEQIVILEKIHFETARAEIRPESHELLRQVAQVLIEHPEIARIAVDGHTDSRGTELGNIRLSQERALAVVRWLNQNGVDARRTEARGFGPRRPIADNNTDEGMAKNRRVEFQILLRTDQGEDGWIDGPVPSEPARSE